MEPRSSLATTGETKVPGFRFSLMENVEICHLFLKDKEPQRRAEEVDDERDQDSVLDAPVRLRIPTTPKKLSVH